MASSEADQDPIDAAVHVAADKETGQGVVEKLVRFVPFDPATRVAEAVVLDGDGHELRIVNGAFTEIAAVAQVPADAWRLVDSLAARGDRVIAVAARPAASMRLTGLVAISDPPREDSAAFIATLRELGVRIIMVTGDSAVTASAIAAKVGINGAICPADKLADAGNAGEWAVFARVVPEQKFHLVQSLQTTGHVVGMCGDGTNDAPALRQAQIGIAVSTATDVAKAAAGMVLTEPGLAGIVDAVREGRIGFQRLLTYTLNMLVKKIEIVLFLAIGLIVTGGAIMTPVLMVLMLVTNDFLSMSLTTDRASLVPAPSRWRMRSITKTAMVLGACKLAFSATIRALGKFGLALDAGELQTLAFVTLVFGNQAVMYALRERRSLWSSPPSVWVFVSSAADIGIAAALSLSGALMQPLPLHVVITLLIASVGFALIFGRIKRPVEAAFKVT